MERNIGRNGTERKKGTERENNLLQSTADM